MLCSQQFTDLASLSALAKYTTGGVYCYPGYNPARDAPKLQTEISHNLTRQTGTVHATLHIEVTFTHPEQSSRLTYLLPTCPHHVSFMHQRSKHLHLAALPTAHIADQAISIGIRFRRHIKVVGPSIVAHCWGVLLTSGGCIFLPFWALPI